MPQPTWKQSLLDEIANSESSIDALIEIAEDMGLLEFRGADASKLLQGQLTCDVDAIADGEFSAGALCNNKGRVLATFVLYRFGDSFLMRLPSELIAPTAEYLGKFAQFFKTELIDQNENYAVVLTTKDLEFSLSATDSSFKLEHSAEQIEFWISESDAHLFPSKAAKLGLNKTNNNLFPQLYLSLGAAQIRLSSSEQFLPHDLSLDQTDAVSFNKGCYTGQEIVARMEYRGKPKRRLHRLSVKSDQIINYGDELSAEDSKSKFIVVSSPLKSADTTDCLAVADSSVKSEGRLFDGEKQVPYQAEIFQGIANS